MNAEAVEMEQQTELAQVTKAVAEFDRVAHGIAELRAKYHGVVYDVTTPQGMKDAKEARLAVRNPRYEVERIRKEAKAPILALGKRLDSEAKRITDELLALERPIDTQIDAEERRREAEKQAKIEAEMRRVRNLQERVAELRGCATLSPTSGSALIAEHIADLDAIAVDESFEEFQPQATEAKAAGLARLRELHTATLAHEAEQKRLAEERAELARLRAEQEQRQAAERARLAEEERIAREAREAEAAKERERMRLEREEQERAASAERARMAEEQRRLDAEREAQEASARAERERLAAEERRLADERAAIERREREAAEAEQRRIAAERAEADRLAREQAEKEARERRRQEALENPPTAIELAEAVAERYGQDIEIAIAWLVGTDFSTLVAREGP